MTATRSLLDDLVEGRTYQLSTSPNGLGGTRWDLFDYRRNDRGELVWYQVATCTTAKPVNGHYRDSALAWLRILGHDPDAMDLVLFLDDGYERLRPDAA